MRRLLFILVLGFLTIPNSLLADCHVVSVQALWQVFNGYIEEFNADNIIVTLNWIDQDGDSHSEEHPTSSRGIVSFDNLNNLQTGTLSAIDPRGVSEFDPIDIDGSEANEYGNLIIVYKSQELHLGVSGIVADEGIPVSGVDVHGWYNSTNFSTRTNENGRFRQPCPPYSAVRVNAPAGYTPSNYTIQELTALKSGCNFYKGALAIMGHVYASDNTGMPGVKITATDLPDVFTTHDGFFSIVVPSGYSGTVQAQSNQFAFTPPEYTFSNVTILQTEKDFVASNTSIAGRITLASDPEIGVSAVKVDFGQAGYTFSDKKGYYIKNLPAQWAGSVIPSKEKYTFVPTKLIFTSIDENVVDADFEALATFQVSGSVTLYDAGIKDVQVDILLENPITHETTTLSLQTDEQGYYSFMAPAGSHASIQASASGMIFSPKERTFKNLQCDLYEQNFKADTDLPVIAGRIKLDNAGVGNVKLVFQDGAGIIKECYSNSAGYYSMALKQASPYAGWTGTVTPQLEHFSFTPSQKSYQNLKEHLTQEDYQAASDFPFISGRASFGNVGLKNVRIVAEPTFAHGTTITVMTDAQGYYNICLNSSIWSGRLTPHYIDEYGQPFKWKPQYYQFKSISTPQTGKDFEAPLDGIYISGRVTGGLSESRTNTIQADIVFSDNVTVSTDAEGYYIRSVPNGWSGTARPQSEGYSFDPKAREYSSMTRPAIYQDYVGTPISPMISGRITDSSGRSVGNALLTFVDDNGQQTSTRSDAMGNYKKTVPYGWSGTVTPTKPGCVFDPTSRNYANVNRHLSHQNYTAATQNQMNVFTKSGVWTDVNRWSRGRVPKAGEAAWIAGDCTMNSNIPLLSMLVIDDQDGDATTMARLDMKDQKLQDIPSIINKGQLRTEYIDGMPFPSERKLGGEIIFAFNFNEVPEIGPRQIIPPGIYKKITLTGNKIVRVYGGKTAFVEEIIIEKGSHLGDPEGIGGSLELREFMP